MKKSFLFTILSLFAFFTHAQLIDSNPVNWSASSEQINENEYLIKLNASIEPHWHLYSQNLVPLDEGPLSTYITFDLTDGLETVGETKESTPTVKFEEIWNADIAFFENEAEFSQIIKITNPEIHTVSGNVNYMSCQEGECTPPMDFTFEIDLTKGSQITKEIIAKTDSAALSVIPNLANLDLNNPINPECGESDNEDKSYWMLFVFGLLGGLVSLVTPCVFPMIPLTVSFFTKGGKDKSGIFKALLYGVSIIAVYVALSIPFYFGADGKILNEIAAGAILNLVFFVVFLVFAFSFFGFYEIGLPASWANKADKAADMGGFIGIIFMALVLAIVSFSCTGPLLGSVLAGSLTKGPVPITMAMLGFGVGLGLPFTLFAAFPSLLKSLPQSGGWLNSVKVVLGFVEVALAFKFLSTADLVEHWGLLKYELFLVLWILCAIGTSLYLFGLIKFPHDSPIKKLSKMRIVLATGFAVLAVYFALGFRLNDKIHSYQSLNLLSGIAPPVGYSWAYPLECPNGFECYHDFESGMAAAKESGKPILLDFTGHACTNCRRMEDNVWSQKAVFDLINEDYILISLYVDDTEELPLELQGEVSIPMAGGKFKQQKIKTIGNKWTTFEQLSFGKISQPYYVLLSSDGYLLNHPKAYTPDVQEYADWLSCGLEAYKKLQSGEFDKTSVNQDGETKAPVEVEEIVAAKWRYEVKNMGNNTYEVSMIADLAEGWHTYSQFQMADEGPLSTWIQFEENEFVKFIGEVKEPDMHEVYDPVWDMEIKQFEKTATFIYTLEYTGSLPYSLNGTIDYMACDSGKCINLNESFQIEIK
jgi:thiol:disulfide interchange protein DsbD